MMKKVLAVAMAAALVVAGTQTKSVKAAEAEDFGDLTAFIAFFLVVMQQQAVTGLSVLWRWRIKQCRRCYSSYSIMQEW